MLEKKGAKIYISAPFDVLGIQKKQNNSTFIGLQYAKSHQNGLLNAYNSIQEFREIFQRIKPDLILLYTMKPNIFGNIAAASLDIPVISTVTGLGYTFIKGGLTRYFAERLYKFAFRKTEHIIFHNPDDRQLFVNQGFATEKQCKIIRGSGVNIEKFKPQEKFQKTDKFVFIFVGRLLIDKGIREYVAAAKALINFENIEFHIVGELYSQNPASLSEEEWLKECDNAKNIVWHKKKEDVRPFIAASNVMVLPSYREGLPMSILEAMSMAKPIITTDVPGCRETVEEGINGFLVPAKDSKTLENAILAMIQISDNRRAEMGRYSREKAVEEFSNLVVADAYEKLIFNL